MVIAGHSGAVSAADCTGLGVRAERIEKFPSEIDVEAIDATVEDGNLDTRARIIIPHLDDIDADAPWRYHCAGNSGSVGKGSAIAAIWDRSADSFAARCSKAHRRSGIATGGTGEVRRSMLLPRCRSRQDCQKRSKRSRIWCRTNIGHYRARAVGKHGDRDRLEQRPGARAEIAQGQRLRAAERRYLAIKNAYEPLARPCGGRASLIGCSGRCVPVIGLS